MADRFEGWNYVDVQSRQYEKENLACERACALELASCFNNTAGTIYLWIVDRGSLTGGQVNGGVNPVCVPIQIPSGATGTYDRTVRPRLMSSGILLLASTTPDTLTLIGTNGCFFEASFRSKTAFT